MLPKVDPVSWTVVDAQLADAFTNWLCIADMSKREPIQPRGDGGSRIKILELRPPLVKCFSLPELEHS